MIKQNEKIKKEKEKINWKRNELREKEKEWGRERERGRNIGEKIIIKWNNFMKMWYAFIKWVF